MDFYFAFGVNVYTEIGLIFVAVYNYHYRRSVEYKIN